MPSSVFTWPDAAEVEAALRRWAAETAPKRPELLRVGYFGSYARGDWGVGSDVDVVVVIERTDEGFLGREWRVKGLPVPAEVLIYTAEEPRALLERGGRFAETLRDETVWVYGRE